MGGLVSIVSYSCRSLRISLVGAFSMNVKTGCGTDGALHSTISPCLLRLAGCCWVVTQAVTQAWEWREFPVPVKSAALCLGLISLGTTMLS